MSREVRRVALDFDWPLDKTWAGYLMPDALCERNCEACGGTGYSAAGRWLSDTFYGDRYARRAGWHNCISQAEVDYLFEHGRLRKGRDPETAAEVNALNESPGLFGHDAINRHLLIAYRLERLGLPELCDDCEGNGSVERYRGQRADAEAWEPTEPPTGEGWQFWETASEGSPISPVFPTREALVEWLTTDGGPRGTYSVEAAEAITTRGHSLGSFVISGGRIIDGVEALTTLGGAS